MSGRDFVVSKASSDDEAALRVVRAEAWAAMHPRAQKCAPPKALHIADEIRVLVTEFSNKCAELRVAMKA